MLVTAVVVGIATAITIATGGGDVLTPVSGVFVIALYGMAVGGIGLAVGGLARPSLAAPTVIVVIVGMLLIDILGRFWICLSGLPTCRWLAILASR